MKNILATLVLAFSFSMLSAQMLEGPAANEVVAGAEAVHFSERTGTISYIRFGESGPAKFEDLLRKKQPWMPEFKGALSFKALSQFQDELGMTHRRLLVQIDGIEVEGAMVIVHERNGRLSAINGDLFRVNVPTEVPIVSAAQGIDLAKNHIHAQRYMWEIPGADAHLQRETGNPKASFYPQPQLVFAPKDGQYKRDNFVLAWKMDVYAQTPLSRQWIFVDAKTGAILYSLDRIHTADVVGSAVTRYSGTLSITADQVSPSSFRLRETGRGGGIQTWNCQTGTTYASAVDFTDNNNVWNNVNAAQDEIATDAHLGTEATWDYFFNNHNWNSFDNNGTILLSYAHYGVSYGNAFWDGTRMTYGDGDGGVFNSPTTTFDICGHEVTHGVTEFSAGLIYADESGALNESFSDIFGNVIEKVARPSNASWLVGEDATSGVGIRNMSNPPQFNDPDCYGGPLWIPGADVHYNSGVQNKWFYFLTQGGSGTNAIGNAYNVTALGMTKAAKIAFRNLTVYLTPSSEYADARVYAIQSASDLYGACTTEMIATANAWHAVGVGGPFSSVAQAAFTAIPTTACSAPATFTFNNSSNSATTFLWNFGDGTTSTAVNPSHTYNNLGSYSVKLIAYGCNGAIDSTLRTNYIVLDTNIACAYTLPVTGNTNVSSCSGNILDPGGFGDYPNNANTTITIAPPGASSVTLTFNSFALEDNWDFLNVYDGPSTSSALIGSYTGFLLPNGGTIVSSTGAITIEFTSDMSVVEAGFNIDFSCSSVNAPPVAAFNASPYFTCDGTIQFNNTSQNSGGTITWNFGDGGTSSQTNPQHTYTTAGSYTVSLIVCNNFGCDTIVRPFYVIYDPQATSCTVTNLPTTGTNTYTTCRGTIMDDGGTSNYSDNVDVTAVIAPPGATQVSLSFTAFDVESGWDYVYVYDGNSIAAPLMGTYSGNALPLNGLPFASSGGALTVRFTSDASVTFPGFVAEWRSMGGSGVPNAQFTSPVSGMVGQTINFTDMSSGGTYWTWDFGDGTGSNLQNPSHSYAAPGNYIVTLRVTNSAGCDDSESRLVEIGGVGIDSEKGIVIALWPNPANSQVHLLVEGMHQSSSKLHLRNALGQEVFGQSFQNNGRFETLLDVSKLSRGLYFLTIEREEGNIVRKLMLE